MGAPPWADSRLPLGCGTAAPGSASYHRSSATSSGQGSFAPASGPDSLPGLESGPRSPSTGTRMVGVMSAPALQGSRRREGHQLEAQRVDHSCSHCRHSAGRET